MTSTWGWLILLFPLVGTVVISLGYKVLPGRLAGWLGSAAILGAFVCAIGALLSIQDRTPEDRQVVSTLWTYASTAKVDVGMTILVDPLSVLMALVVSGVSFLIHVYSVSYMGGDRGYARYFAYLNFFVFSMLLLVMGGNLVLLIVGWAFVGAASYLLISFWYRRGTATYAGLKAFVINVVGDIGLVVAAFLLWSKTGALDWTGVFRGSHEAFHTNDGVIVAACLLLTVGAFAKSAQVPLHTWLPDAMEGPTPVSALIHAATMVTAGVYLIARTHPLYELAPTAADITAVLATFTFVYAATCAMAITDLKRIIAYSTISQIGYMVVGVALFGYANGLFHLMTHAFFKALLFMGAGSIIAAMAGEQNIDRMGGLRRAMPFTYVTFMVGSLALAGFPPFSGWLSKDSIVAFAFDRGGWYVAIGVAGYVAALLTAFYTFRVVFRVFSGEPVEEARLLERGELAHAAHRNPLTGEEEDTDVGFPGPEHHIAERELPMKFAMSLLAVLAFAGGTIGIPDVSDVLERFLEPTFADSAFQGVAPSDTAEWIGLAVGAATAAAGIGAAWLVYLRRPGLSLELARRFPRTHRFLERRWYFDELYDLTVVRPLQALAAFSRRAIERGIVQGLLVGGAGGLVRGGMTIARTIQNGYLRAYALLLLTGLAGLGLYFLLQSS
ncbi:MAG: NADH-quinone oxidoreductase subunit L [Thermoleophilaceae bacterium]|nr:NADH-quinone oxidoreductase subunit L [Thermoleophilaceae bacterium]